jgi:hypothetical protein
MIYLWNLYAEKIFIALPNNVRDQHLISIKIKNDKVIMVIVNISINVSNYQNLFFYFSKKNFRRRIFMLPYIR